MGLFSKKKRHESSSNMNLKPLTLSDASSTYSHADSEFYKPLAPSPYSDAELAQLERKDARLKRRIRLLKFISRALAVLLSLASAVPLALTVVKYVQTRNTYYDVNGERRTAWALDSNPEYTYVCLGISGVSFLLNTAIMIAYCRGIRHANSTAKIVSIWSAAVLLLHTVVWITCVVVYDYGRQPVNGHFKDLWGWTCSDAASEIQEHIPDVNFNHWCTIQTSSFYAGILNVGAGVLSVLIYILAAIRLRSKKRVKRASFRIDEAIEPLRPRF